MKSKQWDFCQYNLSLTCKSFPSNTVDKRRSERVGDGLHHTHTQAAELLPRGDDQLGDVCDLYHEMKSCTWNKTEIPFSIIMEQQTEQIRSYYVYYHGKGLHVSKYFLHRILIRFHTVFADKRNHVCDVQSINTFCTSWKLTTKYPEHTSRTTTTEHNQSGVLPHLCVLGRPHHIVSRRLHPIGTWTPVQHKLAPSPALITGWQVAIVPVGEGTLKGHDNKLK